VAGVTPEEAASLTDLSALGDRTVDSLSVLGFWGEVADPATAVDAMFDTGARQARERGSELVFLGEGQEMLPEGLDDGAVMRCRHARTVDPTTGREVPVPACAWADEGTVGFTLLQRQDATGTLDVPLAEVADLTARLRSESLLTGTTRDADDADDAVQEGDPGGTGGSGGGGGEGIPEFTEPAP
jgi:hypothetical protein